MKPCQRIKPADKPYISAKCFAPPTRTDPVRRNLRKFSVFNEFRGPPLTNVHAKRAHGLEPKRTTQGKECFGSQVFFLFSCTRQLNKPLFALSVFLEVSG